MPAATATEWLTAAAIGAGAYVPLAALVVASAGSDFHLPHMSLAPALDAAQRAHAAAEQAALRARLQLEVRLVDLAWHLQQRRAGVR
jgi:hypothetical protein